MRQGTLEVPWGMGPNVHSNCPKPGIEKAVKCLDCSSSGICQNPCVKSRVEKMVDPALPMSPIHSLTVFIEYLSSWLAAFSSLKSCTTLSEPSFFGTMNIGLLYLEVLGWIMPICSHSCICSSISGLCASGMGNCFWYLGLLSFNNILCSKWCAFPMSWLACWTRHDV